MRRITSPKAPARLYHLARQTAARSAAYRNGYDDGYLGAWRPPFDLTERKFYRRGWANGAGAAYSGWEYGE